MRIERNKTNPVEINTCNSPPTRTTSLLLFTILSRIIHSFFRYLRFLSNFVTCCFFGSLLTLPVSFAFCGSRGFSERYARLRLWTQNLHSIAKWYRSISRGVETPLTLPVPSKVSGQFDRATCKMKGSGLFRLLSCLLVINLAVAWPWPESLGDLQGMVLRRQESSPSGVLACRLQLHT